MQKCGFCGSTVIVPAELRAAAGTARSAAGAFADKAIKLAEITALIAQGKKLEAIKEFRETFGTGLKEAKDAVDALERGEGVDITAIESGVAERSVRDNARRATTEPVQISIDREAAVSAGKTVGGIILVVSVIAIVIAIVAIAATYFFLRSNPVAITNVSVPQKPSAAAAEVSDVEELLRIGGEGTGAGRFTDNRSVAIDGQGRIYSGDYSGGRIQVFDATGIFLTQWTAEEGMLLFDLAADRKGSVYLLGNKGIRKFEGSTGRQLAKADNFSFRTIASTLDGKLIAAGREGITVFDGDLKVIREFKNAHRDASADLGFESIAVDGNGVMFLLDRLGKDIIKFSSEGKFLNRIPAGLGSPNSIALDPAGNIYVAETSSIVIFSADGRPVKSVEARQAFGITFNDAGEMFVAARPYIIKQKVRL